jgi:hypothetical protein
MTDGQTKEISLTSGLDVKSSDMLVPIEQPLFQHNRQRYQGKYLPTSLRFEHDGWAAGKDVYNFDIEEAALDVDGYTITKQLINKTPMYRILLTKDKKRVGSFYYIPTSSVLSSAIPCAVTDTVNPVVSGTINGKRFSLAYDSVSRTFVNTLDNDVLVLSTELGNDCRYIVTLQDTSATIDIDFGGMQFPTETVKNGEYSIAKFSGYSDSIAVWSSGKQSVSIKNGELIYSYDGTALYTAPVVVDNSGHVQASFKVDLLVQDNVAMDIIEFTPMLTEVSIETNSKVAMSASSIAFNKQSVTIEDREHTDRYNSDKLYANSLTDYNKQTIEQKLPMWVGVSADSKIRRGEVVTPAGVTLQLDEKEPDGVYSTWDGLIKDARGYALYQVSAKTTEDFMEYAHAPDIHACFWEGTKCTELNTGTVDSLCIELEAIVYDYGISDDDVGVDDKIVGRKTFYLNITTAFSGLNKATIRKIFTCTWRNNYPEGQHTCVFDVKSMDTWKGSFSGSGTLDLSFSKFYKSGTVTYSVSNDDKVSLNVSDLVFKGELRADKLPEHVKYVDQTSYSDDYKAVWYARCCEVLIASDIYISSGAFLPVDMSSDNFAIVPAVISDSSYVDASDFFKHSLGTCSVNDGVLSAKVYLCSKDVAQYMFYTTTSADSSDMNFVPGHIMNNALKSVSDDTNNMQCYIVPKSFSGTSIDTTYAVGSTLTANIMKTPSDAAYTYIKSISSDVSTTSLAKGNTFTEEYAESFIDSVSYTVDDPIMYIDITKNVSDNSAYLTRHLQQITLLIDNVAVTNGNYTLDSIIPSFSGTFIYKDYANLISFAAVSNSLASNSIDRMVIQFSVPVNYAFSFYVPYVFNSTFRLATFVNSIATVHSADGKYRLLIDYNTKNVTLYTSDDDFDTAYNCDETWYGINAVKLSSEYVRSIILALLGVYNSTVSINSLSQKHVLSLQLEDVILTFDIDNLLGATTDGSMSFLYTRVEQEALEENLFAKVQSDNEMQFLKQQWDTTNDTENFWWLDSEHVLALTKKDFVIRNKTDELSDWDCDIFEDDYTVCRTEILDSSVLKYFCSSAKSTDARFITVSAGMENIMLTVYNPLDSFSKFSLKVPFTHVDLGNVLNSGNSSICTYSLLDIANVITSAAWSATHIDSLLIIGLHFDNNFNQWTIIIDLDSSSLVRVIQGYGFVGVDGSLTGGEIPYKYFDVNKGFTGTVQPLDSLSDASHNISELSELYSVTDRIVGNDSQQWYITSSIDGIVSHILYSKGIFKAIKLPINNNYSVRYDSGSYKSTVRSNMLLQTEPMANLLDSPTWKAMMIFFSYPILYYSAPKISIANYLQQTLGQAAYVHYNSTSIHQSKDMTKDTVTNNYSKEESEDAFDRSKEESVISIDEISFDRQSVHQQQSTTDPYTESFALFASALISLNDFASDILQANSATEHIAKNAGFKNPSRSYGNYMWQNLSSMAVADMTVQSLTPTHTSEVTAIKTLDMFYSTADVQKVCAGRGYVNHNFVAQCTSQSVTSMQGQFLQQKLLYIVTELTMYLIREINKTLHATVDYLQNMVNANGGPTVVGWVNTVSTGVSVGFATAAGAAMLGCVVTDVAVEALPRTIDAIGGSKLTSSITGKLPKCKFDVEAKHKYGSKTEQFMWPCFGVDVAQKIMDESVEVVTMNKRWALDFDIGSKPKFLDKDQPSFVTSKPSKDVLEGFDGSVDYFIAMIKGKQTEVTLPENMACVIGTESFLPVTEYKNEFIGESEPVFTTPPFQDYIIDADWKLSQTASVGMTTWIGCKDTKIIDGDFSNIIVSNDFCGVAAPYAAIEVKRGIQKKYLRPWAITPQALALNQTGLNCCFEEKAYHAFDCYGYRVVNWIGSAGMNKEHRTWLYSFLVNDRFKRSNKMPLNEYLGNFRSDPVIAISGDMNDKVFTLITQPGENKGLQAGTVGEDKDTRRYALPIFSEFVSTLPAAVKTIAVQLLTVIDGITSLTTENRDLQFAYKSPTSVDFSIGRQKYRYTQEYICSLKQERGVTVTEDMVPCLGLTYIGATPQTAFLYNKGTGQYYTYTGGASLQRVGMLERFRNVVNGRYDFINQEVLMPCLSTFNRLDKSVKDDSDETDNVIVPRLSSDNFAGEIWPPLDTIFNMHSWFRTLSLPCGVTYQGPNRCIVNRFTLQDYMVAQIKSNYGKWKRVPKEEYHPFRTYKAKYEYVDEQIGDNVQVKGWTHNPYLLVTSPLGVDEHTDCLFEWEIVFCWPVEMDKLYAANNFATVNIMAETMTPGGKVVAERPTHVYLTKELFTRTGNYGYYSFRYQSKCGAGNRERLHIWSDQFICVSSLKLEYKTVTSKRTEILTQQVDIQTLKEI